MSYNCISVHKYQRRLIRRKIPLDYCRLRLCYYEQQSRCKSSGTSTKKNHTHATDVKRDRREQYTHARTHAHGKATARSASQTKNRGTFDAVGKQVLYGTEPKPRRKARGSSLSAVRAHTYTHTHTHIRSHARTPDCLKWLWWWWVGKSYSHTHSHTHSHTLVRAHTYTYAQ